MSDGQDSAVGRVPGLRLPFWGDPGGRLGQSVPSGRSDDSASQPAEFGLWVPATTGGGFRYAQIPPRFGAEG